MSPGHPRRSSAAAPRRRPPRRTVLAAPGGYRGVRRAPLDVLVKTPATNGAPQRLVRVAPPLAVAPPPRPASPPAMSCRCRACVRPEPPDFPSTALIILTSGQTGQRPVNRGPAPVLDPDRWILILRIRSIPIALPARLCK
jgi:hypothetical protein